MIRDTAHDMWRIQRQLATLAAQPFLTEDEADAVRRLIDKADTIKTNLDRLGAQIEPRVLAAEVKRFTPDGKPISTSSEQTAAEP